MIETENTIEKEVTCNFNRIRCKYSVKSLSGKMETRTNSYRDKTNIRGQRQHRLGPRGKYVQKVR